jgi:DNA-binding response OmpR family regulator
MAGGAEGAGTFFYVLQDTLQILFVDDDPILREFAAVHLSSEQASVSVAEDGQAALDRLAGEIPDILLLDLEMPRMDGFEVLSRIRADQRLARLPVVVVTGREDVAAIDRAYQLGANFFVVKPINWRLLSYEIRFVHRAHRAELSLIEARAKAGDEAAETARRLATIARESWTFLSVALERTPALKPAAATYAAALQGVVDDAASAA